METWHIDARPGPQPVAADAVALLLDAHDDAQPAARMLAFLNTLAPVDYLSLVEYVPSVAERVAAPEIVEGHARPGMTNVTPDCFARYRRRFWREDDGTRIAQRLDRRPAAGLAAMHVQAEDLPSASWRQEIYDQAHLSDRLSFYYAPLPDATFSINLYRDRAQGGFRRGELERLLAVAPLLARAHRSALGGARDARIALAQRIALADATLRRKAPALSPRERAVCARIACGISAEGIAADLDVSPSTIATLRKRAYGKLAAHGVVGGRLQLVAFVR